METEIHPDDEFEEEVESPTRTEAVSKKIRETSFETVVDSCANCFWWILGMYILKVVVFSLLRAPL